MEAAATVVRRLFERLIEDSASRGAGLDWKTSLQEIAAAGSLGVPEYLIAESGPDHAKTFAATVRVGGRELGAGQGRSKKEAEQRAAEVAWAALRSRAADEAVADPPAV
jgi:ribonuclease-3